MWAIANEDEQFVKSRKNDHNLLVLKTEECGEAGWHFTVNYVSV